MAYRRNGQIKPIKGNSIPHKIICFDTETYIRQDKQGITHFPFRLGVAIYNEIDDNCAVIDRLVLRFTALHDFYRFLLGKLSGITPLYLFAHNIGFDMRVTNLFEYLENEGYSSEPPIINERAFIWRTKKGKSRLICIDTANFAVQTVKLLGKSMGYDKLDIDDFNVPDEILFNYCQRDTEIIEKFINNYLNFIHKNNLGDFKVTLASQSLTAWRHRLMTEKVTLHSNIFALELERQAYHGGRVECFRLGKLPEQNYYMLDINSMYPFVMRDRKLPINLRSIHNGASIETLLHETKRSYCIAKVQLKTTVPMYPYLYNGKLCFPVGVFTSVLHDQELQKALDNNHVIQVFSFAQYDYRCIFTEYVDFFYAQKIAAKLSHNGSWEFISKIFLNSLYGKFGQTDVQRMACNWIKTEGIWRIPYSNPVTHNKGQIIAWNGTLYDERQSGETAFSFPAIAGAITAEARVLLWSYIELAGIENVYYCDTDSLLCNQKGYENLQSHLSDTELGKLKLVDSSTSVELRGCKDYVFGDIDKTKGKAKTAETITPNRWRQLQFQSVLAWITAGGKGEPLGRHIEKHRTGNYQKGVVLEDGLIIPYTFDDNAMVSYSYPDNTLSLRGQI